MKTQNAQKLSCPHCGKTDSIRTDVEQSVDVTIFDDGTIENGFRFSDLEVSTNGMWCDNCENLVKLQWDYRSKQYCLMVDT